MKYRALIFILAICLLLSSCKSSDGGTILYDVSAGVQNLDPQFATGATERMIISNVMEGLFRQSQTGKAEPCLVRDYTISEDGKTYLFTLRDDAKWSNGEAVTAHDFVFAFRRLFDPAATSPFAGELGLIENAQQVLAGTLDRSMLGVWAESDTTLQITLTRPDSGFLSLLCESYCMPCNQAFFESTHARYGRDLKSMLFNGPYYVRVWNNESKITLRRNEEYVSDIPAQAFGVDLMIREEADSAARFLTGETDASKIDYHDLPAVIDRGGTSVAFEDTVWVLVLNQNDPMLQDANIRSALAQAVDRALFEELLPGNLRAADTVMPPVIPKQGRVVPVHTDLESAKAVLAAALEEHDLSRLPLSEILICDDDDHAQLAGQVQKNWQQLSVYTGLRRLPMEELTARVQAGEFQAAIIPMTASYAAPEAMLSLFLSDSPQNVAGYKSGYYDSLLNVAQSLDYDARQRSYTRAHQVLLDEGVVIPLYYEVSCYAMASGVEGIEFSPFLSGVYFKHASKE